MQKWTLCTSCLERSIVSQVLLIEELDVRRWCEDVRVLVMKMIVGREDEEDRPRKW